MIRTIIALIALLCTLRAVEQGSTQPADEAAAEDQPSTPTPKVAPR